METTTKPQKTKQLRGWLGTPSKFIRSSCGQPPVRPAREDFCVATCWAPISSCNHKTAGPGKDIQTQSFNATRKYPASGTYLRFPFKRNRGRAKRRFDGIGHFTDQSTCLALADQSYIPCFPLRGAHKGPLGFPSNSPKSQKRAYFENTPRR